MYVLRICSENGFMLPDQVHYLNIEGWFGNFPGRLANYGPNYLLPF